MYKTYCSGTFRNGKTVRMQGHMDTYSLLFRMDSSSVGHGQDRSRSAFNRSGAVEADHHRGGQQGEDDRAGQADHDESSMSSLSEEHVTASRSAINQGVSQVRVCNMCALIFKRIIL